MHRGRKPEKMLQNIQSGFLAAVLCFLQQTPIICEIKNFLREKSSVDSMSMQNIRSSHCPHVSFSEPMLDFKCKWFCELQKSLESPGPSIQQMDIYRGPNKYQAAICAGDIATTKSLDLSSRSSPSDGTQAVMST